MKTIYQRIRVAFLTSRYSDIYFKISATIWLKKCHMETAIWFLKRAIKALSGKEGIMDSAEGYSKGGYKYYHIVISKLPVNKNHDYTKF